MLLHKLHAEVPQDNIKQTKSGVPNLWAVRGLQLSYEMYMCILTCTNSGRHACTLLLQWSCANPHELASNLHKPSPLILPSPQSWKYWGTQNKIAT